jgi:hypothetical protein
MPYVQVALVADTPEFIEACKSMGWDETNYKEVLDELSEFGVCYIPNFDVMRDRLYSIVDSNDIVLFGTVGDMDGINRWYESEVSASVDKKGNVWVSERDTEI